jgi:hypothetical protein
VRFLVCVIALRSKSTVLKIFEKIICRFECNRARGVHSLWKSTVRKNRLYVRLCLNEMSTHSFWRRLLFRKTHVYRVLISFKHSCTIDPPFATTHSTTPTTKAAFLPPLPLSLCTTAMSPSAGGGEVHPPTNESKPGWCFADRGCPFAPRSQHGGPCGMGSPKVV